MSPTEPSEVAAAASTGSPGIPAQQRPWQPGFPAQELSRSDRVLVLGGALTRGRGALLQLAAEGHSTVVCVERTPGDVQMATKLGPASWKVHLGDGEDLLRLARSADVVVLDGPTGSDEVLLRRLVRRMPAGVRRVIVRLTGAYLREFGLEPTDAGVEGLMPVLGLDAEVISVGKRSSGHQGLLWATLRPNSPQGVSASVIATAAAPRDRDDVAHLRDDLDNPACTQLQGCHRSVNDFRRGIEQKLWQNIYRIYRCSDLALRTDAWLNEGALTAGGLALARFEDLADFVEQQRSITKKRGRVNREVARAVDAGYTVERFDLASYVVDVHAIHVSKAFRGGKRIKGNYQRSVAEMGGPPTEVVAPREPACPVHLHEAWGVFVDEPGHAQGTVVTDRRLVAYIHLRRSGNHAWYSRIMGHADHLRYGVMYLLHREVVAAWLPPDRRHGLDYVFYGGFNSGPDDGSLRDWKRRGLFRPLHLCYDDAAPWFPEPISLLR